MKLRNNAAGVYSASGSVDVRTCSIMESEFPRSVIPAKAGIQWCGEVNLAKLLDSRLRGNDSASMDLRFKSWIRSTSIESTGPRGEDLRVLRRGQGGFTLIEILVAMVLLVILVSAVYTCFVSVVDTAEIARASADELRVQQLLWKHFTENISAVIPNPNGEYALVGEDESGAYGPSDSLRFTNQLPMGGAKALPGIVKKVEYHIDDPSVGEEGGFQKFAIDDAPVEDKDGVTLFISESPLVLFGEGEGGELFEAEDAGENEIKWEREVPIRSLNFQYYDGTAEEWVDEWNSDETGFLPWAIRVQVNLAKTEGQLSEEASMGVNPQEDYDLDVVVVLSTGAGVLSEFEDPNHFRPNQEAAQEAGAEEK